MKLLNMKFYPSVINLIPVKMVIDWKAQSTFYLQHIRVLLEIKVSTKPKPCYIQTETGFRSIPI